MERYLTRGNGYDPKIVKLLLQFGFDHSLLSTDLQAIIAKELAEHQYYNETLAVMQVYRYRSESQSKARVGKLDQTSVKRITAYL